MNLKSTQDKAGQIGRCKGLEESAAVGLQQAKQRPVQMVWAIAVCSASGLCPLVQAGAECWNSGFRGHTWGEDSGWRNGDSLQRLERGIGHNQGCMWKSRPTTDIWFRKGEWKDVCSSSSARAPKLQLAVEQPWTGGRWNPPKKRYPTSRDNKEDTARR